VLSWRDKVYSHFTTVLKSVTKSSKHACLVLFSSFCEAVPLAWEMCEKFIFIRSLPKVLQSKLEAMHPLNLMGYNTMKTQRE
jgi:hypothetical protein